MAHPKHKHSKTRRDKRRTHDKAVLPTLTTCSNCGASVKMHTICGECGYYRGKKVIEKEIAV
jgi:large subunit ribosomal protein L32